MSITTGGRCGEVRVDLDERRVRGLGRRPGTRSQPRAPLRDGRLRGDPLLRHRARAGGLSPPRAPRAARRLRRALLPADAVLARGAARGDQRADPAQRPRQLLHPPARLSRLRRDGPVRADRPRGRDDRRLALGRLPRRGGQAQGSPGQGLVLAPDLPVGPDPAREGLWSVPELDPGQDRRCAIGIRRGDPARRGRPRLRGVGREHLRPSRGRAGDPRPHELDPRRDHAASR